jgi:hypothetical protein
MKSVAMVTELPAAVAENHLSNPARCLPLLQSIAHTSSSKITDKASG